MARTLIGNFKGPKGDTGAQGATGPVGPEGKQGPVGPAGGVNSVNGVQGDVVVGGRNYILGTGGVDSVNLENNTQTPNPIVYGLANIDDPGDGPFVFSFDYEIELERNGGTITFGIGGNWKVLVWPRLTAENNGKGRIVKVFNDLYNEGVAPGDYIQLAPEDGATGTAKFYNIKLERGNVPTAWSPAPEDLVYKWQTDGVLPHRYVVRWDKAQNTCTRMYDAAGITTDTAHFAYHGSVDPAYDNPFDKLYPWSHRKLCKADKAKYKELYEAGGDVMGAITMWEGEPGFKLGGDGMDMVYTPEFWMKQWEDGGYVYIGVADGPIYGWQYVPEMVLGRYLASDDGNDGLTSRAGDVPLTDTVSIGQLHAKAKADHLTLDTIQTWDPETVLMVVEYANMNCQSAIGRGVDALYQAGNKRPVEAATNSKTVKVSTTDAAIIIPGAIFAVGDANDRGTVARAAVVSKSDADGVTTVTLDREITITTAQIWNIHGLYNSPDEAIGSKSGYIGTDGKCHAYYRGRNCWGNCYHYLLGAYREGGTGHIWVAPDVETADELDALDTSKCIDTGCALPQGASGAQGEGYIKELYLLPDYPMAPFCKTTGGDSTKPVGDYVWWPTLSAGNTICLAGALASSGLGVGRFTAHWRAAATNAWWSNAASLAFRSPKGGV